MRMCVGCREMKPKRELTRVVKPAEGDAHIDLKGKACRVRVPDDQLSLAIGKEGQNARLAARLTSYKIDIKPASHSED